MIFKNPAHRYVLACDRCGTWFPLRFNNGLPVFINHIDKFRKLALESGWLETEDLYHLEPGNLVHMCPACNK